MSTRFMIFLVVFFGLSAAVSADTRSYPGPYRGQVVRVIDADTIEVEVRIWPGMTARFAVRERGIDAPETYRPACEEERLWGEDAADYVKGSYGAGMPVEIDNVEEGTYGGRVLANIRRRTEAGTVVSLQSELLERGLAVEWTPEQDDVPWCLLAMTRQ